MCFGETVSHILPVTERIIETNGVQLHTVEAGAPDAPVVVLAHGFPELAYSWRHQIPVLAAAGFQPGDLRGDDDPRSELAGLQNCPFGKVGSGDSAGESEIVLDP